jgi:hypothetical protein
MGIEGEGVAVGFASAGMLLLKPYESLDSTEAE